MRCCSPERTDDELRSLFAEKIRARDAYCRRGFPGNSDWRSMLQIISLVDTLVLLRVRFGKEQCHE
jgi:hypothetical protein